MFDVHRARELCVVIAVTALCSAPLRKGLRLMRPWLVVPFALFSNFLPSPNCGLLSTLPSLATAVPVFVYMLVLLNLDASCRSMMARFLYLPIAQRASTVIARSITSPHRV